MAEAFVRVMTAAACAVPLMLLVACGGEPGSDVDASTEPPGPDADLSCSRDELLEWFMDADGDGFGDPAVSMVLCQQPDGFVDNGDDCDDSTAATKPGGTELLCDGIDNDCDSVTADLCASGCSPFSAATGEYALCVNVNTQAGATVACESMDMRLAQIDDAVENGSLQTEMTARFGGGQFFVGGQDVVEGVWRWPDGTQFWIGAANGAPVGGAFISWTVTEPNNANGTEDCMEVAGAGLWNDIPCTDLRRFACERPRP